MHVAWFEILAADELILARQQLLVDGPVRLGLPFEFSELDQVQIEAFAFFPGFPELTRDRRIPLLRLGQVSARQTGQPGPFGIDPGTEIVDLRFHADDVGVTRAENRRLVGALAYEPRIDHAQIIDDGGFGKGPDVVGCAFLAQLVIAGAQIRSLGVGEHELLVEFVDAALQQRRSLSDIGDLKTRLELGRRLLGALQPGARVLQSA